MRGMDGRYPHVVWPHEAVTGPLTEIEHSASWDQDGLIRVVATRIGWDGTMQRRVMDTAHSGDSPRWENLAARALVAPPPYRPAAGAPLYHVSLNGGMEVLVAEHDLYGPLLDLVTAVMALGEEVLARPRPATQIRQSFRQTS
jgi:hypothetical protein